MAKAIQRLLRDDQGILRTVLIDAVTLKPVTNPEQYQVINNQTTFWEPVQDVSNPDVPSKVQLPAEILNEQIRQAEGDPNRVPVIPSPQERQAASALIASKTGTKYTPNENNVSTLHKNAAVSAEPTSPDRPDNHAFGGPKFNTPPAFTPASASTPTASYKTVTPAAPGTNFAGLVNPVSDNSTQNVVAKADTNTGFGFIGKMNTPVKGDYRTPLSQVNWDEVDVAPDMRDKMKEYTAQALSRNLNLGVDLGSIVRDDKAQKAIRASGASPTDKSYHMAGIAADISPMDATEANGWASDQWDSSRTLANELGMTTLDKATDPAHMQMSQPGEVSAGGFLSRHKTDMDYFGNPIFSPEERANLGIAGVPIPTDRPKSSVAQSIIGKVGTETDKSNYNQTQENPLSKFDSVTGSASFSDPNQRTDITGTDKKGYSLAGSPGAVRNNNPGNLVASDWTKDQPGFVGVAGDYAGLGFGVFDTPQSGLKAKTNLLTRPDYQSKTIKEAITSWAPPKDNNTASYIKNVAEAVGVSPTTKISDLTTSQFGSLQKAMETEEGFKGSVGVKDSLGRSIGTYQGGKLTRDTSAPGFTHARGSLGDSPSETSGIGRGSPLGGSSKPDTSSSSTSAGNYSGRGGQDSPSESSGVGRGMGLGASTKDKDKDNGGRSVGPSGGGRSWGGPR